MKRPPTRWLFLGLLALVSPLALVRVVPKGTLGVIQNRVGRPDPLLLSPGAHFRIPLWERVWIYPLSPVRIEGEAEVVSQERAHVRLPFSFQVQLNEERILRAHREGAGTDALSWIRKEAEKRLLEIARRAATYQLLREKLPEPVERKLLKELEPLGVDGKSLKVGSGQVSPEVLASFDPGRLVRLRRNTGARVVIVGLDGADWDFALPMIQRGELPTLARLRKEGAYGKIRTNNPALSPLLWTTVATGKSPDIHGINDFLVLDSKTGRMVPISSEFRKVKALWNMIGDAGLTSEFIAWWATWPAEPVRGIMVSDRVSYSLFSFLAGERPAGHETYPEGYFEEIRPKLVSEEDVTFEQLSRLVHVSRSEYAAALKSAARRGLAGEDLQSVATLVRVLASTENYDRIALDLLGKKQPDLLGVYFQGIDEVNHRFAHLAPPRMPEVSTERFAKYRDAVASFYRLQDRLLGDLIDRLAPDSTLILLSDHGFASGSTRPTDVPPFIEDEPGRWHAPYGILVFWGKHVRPGPLPTASLFDITPTVLDLLGLPLSEDMPGKSLRAALEGGFEGGSSLQRIASYEAFGDPLRPSREGESQSSGAAASEAMVETLRSLGYVGPAPERAPATGGVRSSPPTSATTALYHSNLASILATKGEFERAEEEYRKSLQSGPTTSALMGLSRLEERKGHPDQALSLLQRIVDRRLRYQPELYLKMADLFYRAGRADDGFILFDRMPVSRRDEPLLDTARGVLYSRLGRTDKAEETFRKALAKDPLSLPPMEELFVLYDRRGELPRLIPDLRAAIRKEEGSFMHHNWLGLALKREGDIPGAEKELQRAVELGPDQVGPAANLGSLYLLEGRWNDAIEVLERAIGRDPGSLETRVNLIVALGRLGRIDDARDRFEEGIRGGLRAPSLYNAMAFAYHLGGRPQDATRLLKISLGLDPSQPDALSLLHQLEPRGSTGQSAH